MLLAAAVLAAAQDLDTTREALEAAGVLEQLVQQDGIRGQALRDYEGMRQYVLTTSRLDAAMGVRVNYAHPGRKNLHVVWESGSGLLRSRVLRRVIAAEIEAGSDKLRDRLRVVPENYTFRSEGVETLNGRRTFVFDIQPKTRTKYIIRGRVWVDAEDAAIVRLEGEPLTSGSFWVRRVHIVQEFQNTAGFWLLASTRTRADVRFFGAANLAIAYTDYQVNCAPEALAMRRR